MSYPRVQRTISQPAAVRGYGFWTGNPVQVEFRPAPVGSGVTFVRDDLGTEVWIPARAEHRIDVPRRTNLSYAGAQVEMVEHILAALAGLQIDNCEVGVTAAEMPGCDGSALHFVQALDRAGYEEQHESVQLLEITAPVRITKGESWVEARPGRGEGLRVEFRLDYPHDPSIGRQQVSVGVSPETFREELASCRTFVLKREADAMLQQGLGTHVTWQDLLVFDDSGPIDNPLRFANECARHKALDLIGDLALTGCQIVGHIVAYRSSHQLNAALATELLTQFSPATPLRASA
ncbi:MAG: UDP-3-O-acyl-N-acetylglucosamine deacetylase [Bythopirellula sp.]